MIAKILRSKKIKLTDYTLVLTAEKTLPYTFLSYVFMNEDDFNHDVIEEELLDTLGELGVGYSFRAGPITLRPIGGLLIHSDNDEREVKPYAKAEATVTIPALAELGLGARISGDRTRLYGTAGFDLAPQAEAEGQSGRPLRGNRDPGAVLIERGGRDRSLRRSIA